MPYSEANTPPRSMSPTTMAGSPAAAGQGQVDEVAVEQVDLGRAARALADHHVEAATAGRPARRARPASSAALGRVVLGRGHARRWPGPCTTTWLVRSPVGLSSTGFIATSGSTPGGQRLHPLGVADLARRRR